MGFSEFTSGLLENAVNEFASLPGIGRKTAFRMVMNLLKRDPADIKRFWTPYQSFTMRSGIANPAIVFPIPRYAPSVRIQKGINLSSVWLRTFRM